MIFKSFYYSSIPWVSLRGLFVMQKCSESKFWGSKTLSAVLVFALLVNQIFYGTMVFAAPTSEAVEKLTPKTLVQWSLPEELGRVSHSAETGVLHTEGPVVLLIEDAHAVPTAQESIREIINYLQVNNGLEAVFFEGAEGRIDPLLFRAFADKKELKAVFNGYRDRGELSGVTLAAVLNDKNGRYEGVESQPIYEEQINAWLEADQQAPQRLEQLKTLKDNFLDLELKTAAPALHRLNEAERRFTENHQLENWLRVLGQEMDGTKLKEIEARFPAIATVLVELNQQSSVPEAQAAVRTALESLFTQVMNALRSSVSRDLFEKKQAYLTEKISAGAWAAELMDFASAAHLKIECPEALRDLVRQSRNLEKIQGYDFFEQLEQLSAEVREPFLKTTEDLFLERSRQQLQYSEKLVRLELTRTQWNAIKAEAPGNTEDFTGDFAAELAAFQTEVRALGGILRSPESIFINFYTLAEKREDLFWERIQPALAQGKIQVAAFVGGGFHTEGLQAKLSRFKIAHAVITPEMTLPDSNRDFYRRAMRGQVSWFRDLNPQDDFIEPYSEFSRDAASRLKKAIQPHQIKLWQRAVKEAVFKEDRTEDLPRYMQLLSGDAEASVVPESFKAEWQQKIQRFIDDIKEVPSNSVTALPAMTATAPFANPLVVGRRLPGSWRAGRADLRAKSRDSKVLQKRSEVRIAADDLVTKEIDYAALKGLEQVKNTTVISLQMEMGYSEGFLKAIEARFGKKTAVQVSQASLTGGLGALMHDLFPSWKANGLDIIGIHPIWEEIKKKPYPEGPLQLGQYQRQVMEDEMARRGEAVIAYTIDLNWDEDYKRYAQENEKAKKAFGRQIHVRALKEYTSQYGAPNYHLDAYYLMDETKPDTEENRHRVFDTVYSDDHPAWRDYHLAVYARASEKLIKLLQEQGTIKEKTVEIHNEVFVSMPKTEADPKRTLVHINHSAYLPTIYSPSVNSYGLLGFPAWMRQYIVKDGNSISIVDFAALNYDLLTGVAIDEHYWVLRRNIFRNAGGRLDHYNDGEIRSTNGVLTEHWQSPSLRRLIEHVRVKLSLPEKIDSDVFYKTLANQQKLRDEFMTRQEFIKAVDAAHFLRWMAETQKQPLWLQQLFAETGKTQSDLDAFVKDVETAAKSNEAKAWREIIKTYPGLRDSLLSHPMMSNARRQVPYKGPELWLEVLHSLRDPERLAAFKKTKVRVVIGGRTFSNQADEEFQSMKRIVTELGLEDHFAFIEDYNVFDAAIMFRAMAGVVMLSDEYLEASATSMMKGVVNGAALVGVWGGAMPELFKLIDENGQELDIFKIKTPHNQVVKNLRNGKWKLVNGYLVSYSNVKSNQAGGGRRPDSAALAGSLTWIHEQYSDSQKRRELLWQSIAGTPKVDMREGQARAHMQLIERLLKAKKHNENDVFERLQFNPSDFKGLLTNQREPFIWRHHPGDNGIFKTKKESPRGLFGLVNMFREISTYGSGDERGKAAFETLKYHALNGDLFSFIQYELQGLPAALQPFKNEIETLARQASDVLRELREINKEDPDPAVEDQYLVRLTQLTNLNVQALELIEKLGLWLAEKTFEMYLSDHSPALTEALNKDILTNHFVKKYLARYLETHSGVTSLYTKDSLIRAYGIVRDGKPFIFGVNLGSSPTLKNNPAVSDKAYTDIPHSKSLREFAKKFAPEYRTSLSKNGGAVYRFINGKKPDEKYSYYDLAKASSVISFGLPEPEDVQLLELVREESLAADFLVANRVEAFDTKSLRSFLNNLQQKAKDESGRLKQSVVDEQMSMIASLTPDIARARFGKYLSRMMGLVAILSPRYFDQIKDWDVMVYAAFKKRIAQNAEIFEKGEISFHTTSREQTVGISRVVKNPRNVNEFSPKNIFAAIEFSEERANTQDGKVESRVLELNPISLSPLDEYDVQNVVSGVVYQTVRTGTELMDGWAIRTPVRDLYDRGEKVQHGWGVDMYQIRSVTPRPELVGQVGTAADITVPNLLLGVSLLDLGATHNAASGTVTTQAGLKNLLNLVPAIEAVGFGAVYSYGGLFATGRISEGLHSVVTNTLHWIGDTTDGSLPRVLVSVSGYDTKKEGAMRDSHGNAFSVKNLTDLDLRHASAGLNGPNDTEALLRQVTDAMKKEGIRAFFDFIFWRAPEDVTAANYKQYFYRELNTDERYEWAAAHTDEERLKVMKSLIRGDASGRLPGYFVSRIHEGGQDRLILVQHMYNEPGRDQAVRNPFNPEVIAQSKKEIELAIDRGAKGLRIDLAHKLLNSELKTMMDRWQDEGLLTSPDGAYRADYEPLRDLIQHAKQYAAARDARLREEAVRVGIPAPVDERPFYVIAEAYMPYHHDPLLALGVDAVYYENLHKDYVRMASGETAVTARNLGDGLEKAFKNKDLFGWPANFDVQPLKQSGGSREAFLLALVILARTGAPVMIDARELMDQHGQLIPIPGGQHPFPTSEEIRKRRDFNHYLWQFQQAPFSKTIREFLKLINGRKLTDLRILDNENRDQFISMELEFEEGEGEQAHKEQLLVILNMKPSEDRIIWSQGGASAGKEAMLDLQTGEQFSVSGGRIQGVVFPAEVQYRILKPVLLAARSEVRQAARHSVDNLARGRSVDSPTMAFFRALPEESFATAVTSIEQEAEKPAMVRLAYETAMYLDGDEAEESFKADHPEFADLSQDFLSDSIRAVRDSAHNALVSEASRKLDFAMAFPMQMDKQVMNGLLDFAKMLQGLKAEYPTSVKASILLLAKPEDLLNVAHRDYFKALSRTGIVRILSSDSKNLVRETNDVFLRDHPNALVWGAFEDIVREDSRIHVVRNQDVTLKTALPFAFLLTRKLAEARFLTADILKKVPQSLQGGAIAFNGNSLEVTRFALDLVIRMKATQMLESAA